MLHMVALCSAFQLAPRGPVHVPALPRAQLHMGFEVEDVTQKAVEELGVLSWPGLDKKVEEFSQAAGADELLMVYVREGSATISDDEESKAVAAGQMVMVSDGSVQWSGIADGGLTLISTTTSLENVDEFQETELKPAPTTGDLDVDDPVDDLSLKDAALLLGAGLAAGAVASFGFKTFNGM